MQLSIIEAGNVVRVIAINAGRGLQSRLAEMGLVPGEKIEVISNSQTGPFLIAVKGSRMVLGREMAQKIMVG